MTESEAKINFIANQRFLSENSRFSSLPPRFRFEEEIKYAFLSFEKWSSATAEKEVMAALLLDGENNIKVRDLKVGGELSVQVKYFDLTMLPFWQVGITLSTHTSKEKELFLIPPDYFLPVPKMENKIIEKGKRILGFVHVHPNGLPPSPADLSHFLNGTNETLMGVIAKDLFFLFVKTKETGRTATKDEIEERIKRNFQQSGNQPSSTMKVLTEECSTHKLGFYSGDINENTYSRLA
jgi:hypothetical protein